eukprot:scaffold616_cov257-Pinguiococcus_pyrenoidosus.AAC.22
MKSTCKNQGRNRSLRTGGVRVCWGCGEVLHFFSVLCLCEKSVHGFGNHATEWRWRKHRSSRGNAQEKAEKMHEGTRVTQSRSSRQLFALELRRTVAIITAACNVGRYTYRL